MKRRSALGFIHVFLLIIVVLVAIAGAGYFVFKNGQVKLLDQVQPQTQTPTNPDPTANWRTFTSKNGKYSFKLPEDMDIVSESESSIMLKAKDAATPLSIGVVLDEKLIQTSRSQEEYIFTDNLSRVWQITLYTDETTNQIVLTATSKVLSKNLVVTIKSMGFHGGELILADTLKRIHKEKLSQPLLSTFKFFVTKEAALESISNLEEVVEYLERVPKGIVSTQQAKPENERWTFQVYELNESNLTATFNWYYVDQVTGEITKEFDY